MAESKRILGASAGAIDASIMFIGEAPGRLGADDSAIPFHGDKSGHNFEELLQHVGISRREIFVTNAVLCNPRDEEGRNATPNPAEINACSTFLVNQIRLVDPKIVVTLGAIALKATAAISTHSLTLQKDVRTANRWFNRLLVPLYHPGQRAMLHRSFHNQLSDYQFVAEQLRRLGHPRKPQSFGMSTSTLAVARELIRQVGEISYFALHKLTYLAEYSAIRETGQRLSSAYFVRQKEGPYCTDLHIAKLKKSIKGLKIGSGRSGLTVQHGAPLLGASSELPQTARLIIEQVVRRYGHLSDAQLKTAVYLTAPMRRILRQEKRGRNLFNAAIDLSQ